MLLNFNSKISEFLVNFFFPQTCLFCQTGLEICCEKCFLEIPQSSKLENNILSVYKYSEPKVSKLIWQMKYHHTGDIAELFAPVLAEKMKKEFFSFFPPSDFNLFLIPIPLNTGDPRLHNHANLLVQEISKHSQGSTLRNYKTEVLDNLLIKNSKQKQSHTTSKKERKENIINTIYVNPSSLIPSRTPPLQGGASAIKNIFIIIDDVTTSNSTINEAQKVISQNLKIPEAEILALTIAH